MMGERIHSELQDALKRKSSGGTNSSNTSGRISPVIQLTLQASMEKSQEYTKKGRKWIELTDAVTYYIGKEAAPILTVEKPGFKKLLKKFDAR
uniref:Uncharacterized protein n=1 Tax=Amphimedon queenslandica TaxID=400682 RepID=A0A1X7UIT8_AMPQE